MSKYLIEKNVLIPVEKITKEIEKSSICYSGYTLKGNPIEVYDLENGKLAPIVRYLIESGEEKRSKLFFFLIIGGLILLMGLAIYLFNGEEEIKEPIINKTVELKENPVEANIKIEKNEVPQIQNELINEVEMMTGLKKEAEIEALKVNFELEKKNILISKLENKNSSLQTENLEITEKYKKIQSELSILKSKTILDEKRLIEYPEDKFIYYLGDNIYQKCEKALDEKILNNCKSLYYNFLNNEKTK